MTPVGQIDSGRMRPSGRDRRVVWDSKIRELMMGSSWRDALGVVSDMIPDCKCFSHTGQGYAHRYRVSTSAIPPFDIRISSHFCGKGLEDRV